MSFKILASILVLLLCFSTAKSQSPRIQSDSIAWHINGMNDLVSDVSVTYQCTFVTHGTESVNWIQDNGNFIMYFSVTSTVGEWSDLSEDGSITYNLSGDGLTGQLEISRSTGAVSAHFQLSGGMHEINHRYPIQSYEKL